MSSEPSSPTEATPDGSGAVSAVQETNSVTPSTAGSSDFDIPAVVHDRVQEFQREYPDLARRPLSETHGRALRRICTVAEYVTEHVEPEGEFERGFTTDRLERREAVTWSDAVASFLTAHLEYDGLLARFKSTEGDEFEIPLTDAWSKEYHGKQYARARALERQMGGGERPSGGEASPAWDDPATAMVTLSASSRGLAPVDHLDAVHDSFSYGGARDALRNTMEYHLGLDSSQWGYWLQAEPHGVDADDPGVNACHTHLHVGVYLDAAGLDAERIGGELERVIDKHLDVCDPAGWDAHNYEQIDSYLLDDDGCISVNTGVSNLGSYLAAYMGGSFDERLDERPIEYVAWGALYWATGRARTTRSETVNQAIAADACHQRAESPESHQTRDHADRVELSNPNAYGPDVICAACGSGWEVDQAALARADDDADADLRDALDDGADADAAPSLSELWRDADAAAVAGETTAAARTREKVREWRQLHPEVSTSPVRLAGRLMLPVDHLDVVADVLDDDLDDGPGADSFCRRPLTPEWSLECIVDADGEEHPPGGGGVDMVELHLPVARVRQKTKLSRGTPGKGHVWRCERCADADDDVHGFATHSPDAMARHLVRVEGLERPTAADRVLLRDCVSSQV